jgi:hypothetical protein
MQLDNFCDCSGRISNWAVAGRIVQRDESLRPKSDVEFIIIDVTDCWLRRRIKGSARQDHRALQ